MNIKALVAEFIGTLTLCFIGFMAIGNLGAIPDNGGLPGIALGFGIAIAVMVSATGAISGGHLNPAVTASLLLAKKISPTNAGGYIISQLLGAVTGTFLATMCNKVPSAALLKSCTPAPARIDPFNAFIAEMIATFLLVFAVYGTAVYSKAPKVGGLFIGLTVFMGIQAIGPMTGGALNSARWFGPAVLSGDLSSAPIYIFGPLVGGLLAASIWKFILDDDAPAEA